MMNNSPILLQPIILLKQLFRAKVLGIILINSLFSYSIKGQNFAPIGATWHYTHPAVFSPNIYFNKIEVVQDTIIDELKYSILEKKIIGCNTRPQIEYVREENGKVFYYNSSSSSSHLLYDFNLGKEDTLKIIVTDEFSFRDSIAIDTLFFIIDSTSILNIAGIELKSQHVRYIRSSLGNNTYYGFDGIIIEKLGHNQNMFPWIYSICDGPADAGLRCYEDETIGHYETGIAESCIFTGLEEITENEINIYPNPVQNNLTIHFDKFPLEIDNIRIKLIDITGKLILQTDFQQNIDVSLLQRGTYFLHISDLEGRQLSYKFLKL